MACACHGAAVGHTPGLTQRCTSRHTQDPVKHVQHLMEFHHNGGPGRKRAGAKSGKAAKFPGKGRAVAGGGGGRTLQAVTGPVSKPKVRDPKKAAAAAAVARAAQGAAATGPQEVQAGNRTGRAPAKTRTDGALQPSKRDSGVIDLTGGD